jgi:hypothetical protein
MMLYKQIEALYLVSRMIFQSAFTLNRFMAYSQYFNTHIRYQKGIISDNTIEGLTKQHQGSDNMQNECQCI